MTIGLQGSQGILQSTNSTIQVVIDMIPSRITTLEIDVNTDGVDEVHVQSSAYGNTQEFNKVTFLFMIVTPQW